MTAQGVQGVKAGPEASVFQRDISLGWFRRGVRLTDLAVMSRQLATMISAGLSLLKALSILSEQSDNATLAEVLRRVRADVEAGTALSDALEAHPSEFPPLMVGLIRTGETGGFLERALISVAENYEAEAKLRATIKSAMTYPVVVLGMAVLAVIGMLVFIVPIFTQMFADFGGELPWVTQLLVGVSAVAVWVGPPLVVGILLGVVWWQRNKHQPKVRAFVDPFLLRLPVFGALLTRIAIARLARNLSTLVSSGVPILTSLSIVGSTSGNSVVESALGAVQESVRNGRSMSEPLAANPLFPTMVAQMVAVGEDSGSLEHMLTKISDFYDREIVTTTAQLTALIEPLMIAVVGVVIGGMLIALYLPIFSIFDQIR
ncbi:MAG TPA: type II secretion system F family protein [Glaciihabitans sp.]|jgi:type IV pilus assembly protein PilC|nr:type II secretion system F family protein [Glaciihabitans sp.]